MHANEFVLAREERGERTTASERNSVYPQMFCYMIYVLFTPGSGCFSAHEKLDVFSYSKYVVTLYNRVAIL